MANVEKYGRGSIGLLFGHYDRSTGEKISNQDIDSNRTHLNYNLAEQDQPQSQLDYIRQRLGEVKVSKRKDVNVMCSWAITAPKDLPEQDLELFFKESYSFLKEQYGVENIISAYVHMDETTPHMHFTFVPVVPNITKSKVKKDGKFVKDENGKQVYKYKENGGGKVSAKELITKSHLLSFHPAFDEHMQKVFGRDIGVITGETKIKGNKPIKEFKADIKGLENEITNLKDEVQSLKDENTELKKQQFIEKAKTSNIEVQTKVAQSKLETIKTKVISAEDVLHQQAEEIEDNNFTLSEQAQKTNTIENEIASKNTKAIDTLENKKQKLRKEVKELQEIHNNYEKFDIEEFKYSYHSIRDEVHKKIDKIGKPPKFDPLHPIKSFDIMKTIIEKLTKLIWSLVYDKEELCQKVLNLNRICGNMKTKDEYMNIYNKFNETIQEKSQISTKLYKEETRSNRLFKVLAKQVGSDEQANHLIERERQAEVRQEEVRKAEERARKKGKSKDFSK